ncbi:MAG: 1-phosphofructokinase family hexose kinase [Dehalococcoidia bacterium]|nr:MAG: 1-phosphofructokinase family hexose kinase [Dehalococcoidia bacterium]
MIITVTLNPAIDETVELDRFVEGDTNRVASIRRDIGGKGINVARVLKELGYEPLAMGFAPGDLGRMIEDTLRDENIGVDFTFLDGVTRTNITLLDRSKHRHTVLSAAGPYAWPDDIEEMIANVRRRIRPDTWLVLAGSLPPPCTGEVYARLVREAERAGALTALDADGLVVRQVLDNGGRPTLIKVNQHELQRVHGDPTETEDEVFEAAETIRHMGVAAVVVTRGTLGSVALTPDADYRISAPEVEVVSAVGAGDAFLAAMLLALRRNEGWEQALRRGAAASVACCLMPGSAECRAQDVQQLADQVVVKLIARHAHVG